MYLKYDPSSDLYGYWTEGKWAIEPSFVDASNFSNNYAFVSLKESEFCILNRSLDLISFEQILGLQTSRFRIAFFSRFLDSLEAPSQHALVSLLVDGDIQWGLLDGSLSYHTLPREIFAGAVSAYPQNNHILIKRKTSTKESFAIITLEDKDNKDNQEFDYIYTSCDNIWVVKDSGLANSDGNDMAFFNVDSKKVVSDYYWEALPFSSGFGARNVTGEPESWFFVNESLEPIFDRGFDGVAPFSYGFAAVYRGSESGYINTSGEMVLNLPYDQLEPFNSFGFAIAIKDTINGSCDIIDHNGFVRLSGLISAQYIGLDFPHFVIMKKGNPCSFSALDARLEKIY